MVIGPRRAVGSPPPLATGTPATTATWQRRRYRQDRHRRAAVDRRARVVDLAEHEARSAACDCDLLDVLAVANVSHGWTRRAALTAPSASSSLAANPTTPTTVPANPPSIVLVAGEKPASRATALPASRIHAASSCASRSAASGAAVDNGPLTGRDIVAGGSSQRLEGNRSREAPTTATAALTSGTTTPATPALNASSPANAPASRSLDAPPSSTVRCVQLASGAAERAARQWPRHPSAAALIPREILPIAVADDLSAEVHPGRDAPGSGDLHHRATPPVCQGQARHSL